MGKFGKGTLNFVGGLAMIIGTLECMAYVLLANSNNQYKDGNIKSALDLGAAYNEKATEQCFVEKPETRRHFFFRKSDAPLMSVLIAQKMHRDEEHLGSIPDFKVVNAPCNEVIGAGRKWNSLQEFKSAAQDNFDQVAHRLKVAANDPDATRLSVLTVAIKPVAP